MTILIFPSTLQAAVSYSKVARNWGHSTIGASSFEKDSSATNYDCWIKLPFIGDHDFFDVLKLEIKKNAIKSIYTPHAPTYHMLSNRLNELPTGISLIGKGPFVTQMDLVTDKIETGYEVLRSSSHLNNFANTISAEFVGTLVGQAEAIHGECSREKMAALFAIMQDTPKGDIIEIGALFGKSTYLLNRIGVHLNIGATLAIDPWNLDLSIQHDAPLHIQNASCDWDWNIVAKGFIMNMLALSSSPFNYIRATSNTANQIYSCQYEVASKEFGTTKYTGGISILHIDGNHDEEMVEEDFRLWKKYLNPNGWVIFDDYNWTHGQGPRIVADRVMKELGSKVRRHFVAGGALFLKIS